MKINNKTQDIISVITTVIAVITLIALIFNIQIK